LNPRNHPLGTPLIPSKGAAADLRFRKRGHWDQDLYHVPIYIYIYIYIYICVCIFIYLFLERVFYVRLLAKFECCDRIYWNFPIIHFVEYPLAILALLHAKRQTCMEKLMEALPYLTYEGARNWTIF